MTVRKFIQNNFGFVYRPTKQAIKRHLKDRFIKNEVIRLQQSTSTTKKNIYYLGIVNHSNLGDMGQYFCITNWIKNNYPDYNLLMFETDIVVNPKHRFITKLKQCYKEGDIIIFQSGYCTQDLGGSHDLMHRLICDNLSQAKILMMPQTIFFRNEGNRKMTSTSYNQASNMLFLARDQVSYDQACAMFPDIAVKLFPDIVTTLIGKYKFVNQRNGICLCRRNDGEKFYSEPELQKFAHCLESLDQVHVKDTQSKTNFKDIRKNIKSFIEAEIESYSHYKVTITDRYHGTIYSLCAGTPVIILKTTDHKVVTGADWFAGIYDDYVYVAKDLNDAYLLVEKIVNADLSHELSPYFKEHYYDKLKSIFELS